MTQYDFLPVSKQDMEDRGWWWYDFLLVSGDAYVDHPSFGTAVIGRVLEAEGFRVAVLAQPDWRTPEAFTFMGRPRLGVLIGGGNLDSMVAHYAPRSTAARRIFIPPERRPGSGRTGRSSSTQTAPGRPSAGYAHRDRLP
jgi:hypothetical protein